MKKNLSLFTLFALILVTTFSCNDSDSPTYTDSTNELDVQKVAQILSMRTQMASLGSNQPGGASASPGERMQNREQRIELKRNQSSQVQSSFFDCAIIEETTTEDGNYFWSIDYGTGCTFEENSQSITIFGKVSQSYSFTFSENEQGSSYSSTGNMNFTNYGYEVGSTRTEINGSSSFSDEYSVIIDSVSFQTSNKTISQQDWVVFEKTDSTDVQFSMKGTSEETTDMDDEGNGSYILVKGDFEYEFDNGERYISKVVEPLVLPFSCYNNAEGSFLGIYTRGIEEIEVNGEKFLLDFGSGECDNLVTITDEQGNSLVFDLANQDQTNL